MLRRRRLIPCLVVLGLAAAPAWGQATPEPAVPAAETAVAPTFAPQPPAGMDPHAERLDGRDPVRAALWRAWSAPGDLDGRVRRLQRAGLSAGVGSLDAPARALLLESSLGDPLLRAELAAELAPGLPAAHAALAAEHWQRWDLNGAWDATRAAVEAATQHLEARLWLEAALFDALFSACIVGSLGFLALVAAAAFPRFARDLRRLRDLPGPSAGALAASLVLAPVALGEGLLGLGLGLLALALANGSAWRRLWAFGAGLLLVVALFPLLERRAQSHAALLLDPVALAAWSTEQGIPGPVELARVVRAAESDALAARAAALRLARQGELAEAERRFALLMESDPSADLIANAAAVRLLRGDTEQAIALYERAAEASQSAVVRFNLAQAYGRAIRLDAQELALLEAQSLDPEVLSKLNHRYNGQDGAFVAYLPIAAEPVLARLSDPEATASLARAFRRGLAPGVAGESRGDAVVALWIAAVAGLLLGVALRRFAGPEEDLYAGIARLLQTRSGDSNARMAQLQELRRRQRRAERAAGVLAWLVPGAAGLVAHRPLLAAVSVAAASVAGALYFHRSGAVPDPLALGALPGALASLALLLLGAVYLVLLLVCLALREKR